MKKEKERGEGEWVRYLGRRREGGRESESEGEKKTGKQGKKREAGKRKVMEGRKERRDKEKRGERGRIKREVA